VYWCPNAAIPLSSPNFQVCKLTGGLHVDEDKIGTFIIFWNGFGHGAKLDTLGALCNFIFTHLGNINTIRFSGIQVIPGTKSFSHFA
jgi:hypothetical protein